MTGSESLTHLLEYCVKLTHQIIEIDYSFLPKENWRVCGLSDLISVYVQYGSVDSGLVHLFIV